MEHCAHDVPFQGQRCRLFPAGPAGPPDQSGTATSHRIVAVGQWSDEHEEHFLSLLDLQVSTSHGQYTGSSLDTLLSWKHSGAITDITVADAGTSGEVLLAVASSRGSVCVARLLVPRMPGTTPADIQILDLPCDDNQCLVPWAQTHRGPVASVDVQRETKLILTAGADGSLWVLDPSGSDPGAAEAFKPASSKAYSSFANARWADSQTIVSATTVGQLDLWDTRQGPTPCLRAPQAWGPAGPSSRDPQLPAAAQAQPCWLDVHPSRPNMCAVGCTGGLVAVWDLRMQAAPLSAQLGSADVTEVRFEPTAEQRQQAVPSVLFGTSEGQLGQVSCADATGQGKSGGLQASESIASTHSAINSFDVAGNEIVCVTDSQQLLYARRGGVL